jgi:uncharacterized protein YndB with AHSA1/START domain
MVELEFAIVVERPPSEVFAYLTDVGNVPEWQSSAIEAVADGPMGIGTRINEVRRFLGRRMESTLEVTEYEPDSKFSLRTLSGPVPFEVHHTLRPSNGGTSLTFVGKGEPGGFFRLAEGLVARQAERQFKGDFETLKDLLEARRPA